MPTISLCMIVKDEAEYIGDALASVRDLVDEMVVVDTGSRDQTIGIAESFGASVSEIEWPGSFAAARNVSIDRATSDWVLILDADEVIAREDHETIRKLMSGSEYAYQLPQWTYMSNAATVGWKPSNRRCTESRGYPGYIENHQVRLFPRRSGVGYRGAVHESLDAAFAEQGVMVARVDIPIHHYGKVRSPEYLLRKAQFYLELGVEKANNAEGDQRALFEVAVQLLELDRLDPACALFERLVECAPDDASYQNMLGVTLTKLSRFADAQSILERAVADDRGGADGWNNLGVVFIERDDLSRARECFENAIRLNPDNANSWINLTVVLAECHHDAEALVASERAIELDPKSARSRLLRTSILAAADPSAAIKDLAQVLNSHIGFTPVDVVNIYAIAAGLDVHTHVLPFVERMLTAVANDASSAILLAELLEANRHTTHARELVEALISNQPDHALAHNVLGFVLARNDQGAAALEQFARATELEPLNPDFLKNTALACEALGFTKKAIACYTQLARMHPDTIDYARRQLKGLSHHMPQ